MSEIVREPQQQRSIEKKNRIIEAVYHLFAQKGYFNVSTVDIAKEAKVSTGIVYGYFHDKRDILIEVLSVYVDNVFYPVLEKIKNLQNPINFEKILTELVQLALTAHADNATMHETLQSLTHTDKEVSAKFLQLESDMTQKIVKKLESLGYKKDNICERVHLAIETIQSYAHECVFDKHPYINYSLMHKFVLKMLLSLFE